MFNKEALLAGLIETRGKILGAAASLTLAQQDEVFLGVWSVKDLLAHLIGWDATNLESASAVLVNQLPAFYVHRDKDWRSYNARLVGQYKQEDFAALVAAASHHRLIDFLQAIPTEELDRDRYHSTAISAISKASAGELVRGRRVPVAS